MNMETLYQAYNLISWSN